MRGKRPSDEWSSDGTRITPAGAGKTPAWVRSGGFPGDHPRGCGENLGRNRRIRRLIGSPPRVRGKLGYIIDQDPGSRITPAGAGKTPEVDGFNFSIEDHPRGCGENAYTQKIERTVAGSPPRVRGKRYSGIRVPKLVGITPAGAGKTSKNAN